MISHVQIPGDVNEIQASLSECAAHASRVNFRFLTSDDNTESLRCEIQRRDSVFKAVSPTLCATLTPRQEVTDLSVEFSYSELGTGVIWASTLAFAMIAGLVLAVTSVLYLRADFLGYVTDLEQILWMALFLPFVGVLLTLAAQLVQEADRQHLVAWLGSCVGDDNLFRADDVPEKANNLRVGTIKTSLAWGTVVGLLFGILLGSLSDVEDSLRPLSITVSDFHTCAKLEATGEIIQQEIFSLTQEISGCGFLKIQVVDHRKVEIPLHFTWHLEGQQREAHVTAQVFDKDGSFIVPLKSRTSKAFEPGKYVLRLSRIKISLETVYFEVVGE